jgi:signal peptidase complex subunit 3
MSLFIDADLRSIFSWNTKQLFVYIQAEYSTPDNHLNEVVLWDQIVQSRSEAHIAVRNLRQKYPFIDQGKHLRGRELNLTLVWNVMPKVGYLYTQKQSFRMDPMPDSYIY